MNRILHVFPPALDLSGTDAARITSLLEIFNTVVPCTRVTFDRVSLDGVEPKVFLYKVDAADGRIWKQHVTFDDLVNPLMTFETTDTWRFDEFSNQRNVRNALAALVGSGSYPTLEKIVYNYV